MSDLDHLSKGAEMTFEEIEKRVKEIGDIAWDDEGAHSSEDCLREDFIFYISQMDNELGRKAKLILTTNDVEFARWCA